MVLNAPVKGDGVKRLSIAEYSLLTELTYDLKGNGAPKESSKYLKLPENVRYTFNILKKYIKVDINLGVGTVAWDGFLKAISIRNRITHPKNNNDYNISDSDITICKDVCSWFNDLLLAVFNGVVKTSRQIDSDSAAVHNKDGEN